jgi:hypothetical protein
MTTEGRSAEPHCSSQKERPRPGSKLRAALASATDLLSNFPRVLRRIPTFRSTRRDPHRHPGQQSTSPKPTSPIPAQQVVATPQEQFNDPGPVMSNPLCIAQPGGLGVGGHATSPVPQATSIAAATSISSLIAPVSRLSIDPSPSARNLAIQPPNPPGRTEEERLIHQHFTNEALEMASLPSSRHHPPGSRTSRLARPSLLVRSSPMLTHFLGSSGPSNQRNPSWMRPGP